jgi:hypothetical protein
MITKKWFLVSVMLSLFSVSLSSGAVETPTSSSADPVEQTKASSSTSATEEYKFEASEIEKKPYAVGGYLQFQPILFVLDRSASLYKLRFFKRDEGKTLEEYHGTLQLEGSYEKGIARLFVRTNSELQHTYLGWEHNEGKHMVYEGYLALKPSDSLSFKFGKQTLLWGKGYAFNPVAFLSRPKDPDDPELALEGWIAASMDYVNSFEGPLKTLSLSPVMIPVYDQVNDDFGKLHKLNVGGKLYGLLYDTDIDFIGLTGGSKSNRFGFDFSRNVTTNFEVHGEFGLIKNQTKKVIDREGKISEVKSDIKSALLGIRYLTSWDMTLIFEYYRNGGGFSRLEMKDYFSFIDTAYDFYQSKGNPSLLRKAGSVTQGNYGRPNPMKDYLYLRVTQKEPFNILYFTPGLTTILNPNDRSFSLSGELLYTGFTNWELRLKGMSLIGQRGSEFGEKQNDYRIELRVRYYF